MKTLLVIDDNTDIRENTAEILTLAGFKVQTAENGKKGVELAVKVLPDLIICDIMMPELDGYGVLHLLKNNPLTDHIPFIFLTAKSERPDFRKGMELGADDYITKPFDDLELLRAINIRFKKIDLIKSNHSVDLDGENELLKNIRLSGLLPLDPEQYESESFTKKTIIYNPGKRPKYLYYIKSGKVKTFKRHSDGKEYITNLFDRGDYLGHIPLLENINYADIAEVLEDAEISLIPKDDFVSALYNNIEIAKKFITLIAADVLEKDERLLHLAYDSLRKRVAIALLTIYQKFHISSDENEILDISRDDIAQFVGTATESLIRTLSDFKSEKLIEIKDGKIRILNLKKLEDLPS
ncbi:MAG: response regulator [Chitinophagaceae bacterium]|nr:MAG: response regulator [Chitinophagaceae bacterium]